MTFEKLFLKCSVCTAFRSLFQQIIIDCCFGLNLLQTANLPRVRCLLTPAAEVQGPLISQNTCLHHHSITTRHPTFTHQILNTILITKDFLIQPFNEAMFILTTTVLVRLRTNEGEARRIAQNLQTMAIPLYLQARRITNRLLFHIQRSTEFPNLLSHRMEFCRGTPTRGPPQCTLPIHHHLQPLVAIYKITRHHLIHAAFLNNTATNIRQ